MKVFVRYSAAEVLSMDFVRWERRRYPRHWDGSRQPGWWGVGAVVHSNWIWDHPDGRKASRSNRLPPNHSWLAPHTEMYFSYRDAVLGKGQKLKRPTLEQYERLLKARRVIHSFHENSFENV